jgi:hypothetical protein
MRAYVFVRVRKNTLLGHMEKGELVVNGHSKATIGVLVDLLRYSNGCIAYLGPYHYGFG